MVVETGSAFVGSYAVCLYLNSFRKMGVDHIVTAFKFRSARKKGNVNKRMSGLSKIPGIRGPMPLEARYLCGSGVVMKGFRPIVHIATFCEPTMHWNYSAWNP